MNKRAMKEKSLQPSSDDISIGELQSGVQVYAREVKILMRLLVGNISAAHPSVLYNRLIRHHDSLLS